MKARLFALIALLALWSAPASAQITVTYTFTNGTTADADQVNANFTSLSSAALNRTGGTITGNILVNAGVTVDGVDIGAVLGGTGNPTFASVTATGNIGAATMTTSNTGASSLDVAGGLNIGTGNVALVDTTGKISAITSTFFANLSGSNLTNLTAANLTGTVPVANGGLGANNSAVAQGNTIFFNGTGTTAVLAPGTAGQFLRTGGAGANPTWSNDGSNLTSLVATNLASGTVPNGRIAGTYTSAVTFSNAANAFQGAYFAPDGSAGIDVAACNTTSGGALVFKKGILVSGC